MDKFSKDAFALEKFIHKMLPLKAKISEDARLNDNNLANNFEKKETKEFDGVVYFPNTREVYCSFYNNKEKVAVLVPVTNLIFENKKAQKQVDKFIKTYSQGI